MTELMGHPGSPQCGVSNTSEVLVWIQSHLDGFLWKIGDQEMCRGPQSLRCSWGSDLGHQEWSMSLVKHVHPLSRLPPLDLYTCCAFFPCAFSPEYPPSILTPLIKLSECSLHRRAGPDPLYNQAAPPNSRNLRILLWACIVIVPHTHHGCLLPDQSRCSLRVRTLSGDHLCVPAPGPLGIPS